MVTSAQAQPSTERVRWQNVVLVWTSLLFLLFPVLAALGIFMRAYQSGLLPKTDPAWFYTALTLHGLGMVGLWYTTSFAGMAYLASRYVRLRPAVMWATFALTL